MSLDPTKFIPYEDEDAGGSGSTGRIIYAEERLNKDIANAQQLTTLPTAVTGTTTGASSYDTVIDTGATFTSTAAVNDVIYNSTNDFASVIISIDNDTTLTVAAQESNTWETNDTYTVKTAPDMVVLLTQIDGSNIVGFYKRNSANNAWVLVSGGGGGANTALSNLASIAINTSLISDEDSTDDLGSTSIHWKDIYIDRVLNSTGNLTIENDFSDGDIIFKVNDGGVDTEVMRIDGSESKIGLGTSTPTVRLQAIGAVHAYAESGGFDYGGDRGLASYEFSTSIAGALFTGTKARGTIASPSAAGSSDFGTFFGNFFYDGTSNNPSGGFGIRASGAISTGVTPADIIFNTTETTSSSFGTTRLSIKAAGHIGIGTTSPDTNSQCEIETTKTYGLLIDNNNIGSGAAIKTDVLNGGGAAFNFTGSEVVNAAVGGSQDYKDRVFFSGFTRFQAGYTT